MATGTVTHYDPSRGTGTIACASGALFPFTLREAQLSPGDRVSFLPTGGIAGVYALNVERAEPAPSRLAVQAFALPRFRRTLRGSKSVASGPEPGPHDAPAPAADARGALRQRRLLLPALGQRRDVA